MQYFIRIKDQEIPVTEPVYKLYCQGERKERQLMNPFGSI